MIALQPNWRYVPTSLKDTTLVEIVPLNTLSSEQRSKLVELLSKEMFSGTDSKDYSDLALFLLDTGFDSLNCQIIAGMQSDYKVEIEPYFVRLLEEVGFDHIQHKDDRRIQFLAREFCDEFLEGNVGTKEILARFHALWLASKFDSLYSGFIRIIDASKLIQDGYVLLEGFNLDNIDEFVRANCLVLKLYLTESLPKDFEDYGFCKECGYFAPMHHITEEHSIVYRNLSENCPQCAQETMLSCSTFPGQREYLRSLGHNFD